MTKLEMAKDHAFLVYSDADHAKTLAEDIQQALKDGDLDRALEFLRAAEKPAGMLEARIRWAREAVESAQKEAAGG